jgi:hypothetical protein
MKLLFDVEFVEGVAHAQGVQGWAWDEG